MRLLRLLASVVCLGVTVVEAFSFMQEGSSSASSSSLLSRRKLMVEGVGSVLLGIPLVAHGTTTTTMVAMNEDITTQVAFKTALRNVKRALKQVGTLEPLVVAEDYENLRSALRQPPVSEIRKNCFVLVRGAGEEQQVEEGGGKVTLSYKKFIAALEQMDSTAGLAIRGRQIPAETLLGQYQDTVKSLEVFVETAEPLISIPETEQIGTTE